MINREMNANSVIRVDSQRAASLSLTSCRVTVDLNPLTPTLESTLSVCRLEHFGYADWPNGVKKKGERAVP